MRRVIIIPNQKNFLDYRAKMVKLKFLLILKTGIFLLSLLVLQGVNGDKVFAQPLPALEYCEPGTLINCDEYPFYHGSYCCGAGGCPELGADNPGAWAGYSWEEYRCQAQIGYNYCVTYITTKAYECYAGDVCKAGYSTTDSFLEAGQCDNSGAVINCYSSGSYKECCSGSYPYGSPTSEVCTSEIPNRGGDRYGGCNVGSGSACGTSGSGGFITCNTPDFSYYDAYGDCQAAASPPTSGPTPTPGGPTPVTPTPQESCENCRSGEWRWCAPNANDCSSVGGRVIPAERDCYCSDPNTVYCCTPQACPAQMNVEGTYNDCTSNAYVEVKVKQDPRTIHGSVDCGCAYSQLDVKIVSSPENSGIPYGYVVCSVGSESCKNWSSCFWNITNMQAAPDSRAKDMPIGPYPQGRYVLEVSYGGHIPNEEEGNICSDPICGVSDEITLGTCPIPTQPPPCLTTSCPAGTTPVEVNLSAYNPRFENYYNMWAGNPYGVIGQGGDCCPWDPEHCGGGSCCPNGESTGLCSTNYKEGNASPEYNISNTITGLKSNTNYLIQISSWGARGSVSGERTYQRPNIKLSSGGMSSAWYKLTDNYRGSWGSIKPNGPWETKRCLWYTYDDTSLKVDLASKGTSYYGWWGTPWGASFDNLRLWECSSKTCSVNAPSEIKKQADPFQVSFFGSGLGSGETTRLWLEKRDGGEVTGVVQGTDYLNKYCSGGKCYYELARCTNNGSGFCNDSINLTSNWPVGEYYLHCDIPHSPGACSGNPFCNYTSSAFCDSCPGAGCSSNDCGSGWQPCAINDKKCLSISCENVAPDKPSLYSPVYDYHTSSTRITLDWNPIGSWGVNCNVNNNQYKVYLKKGSSSFSESDVVAAVGSGTTQQAVTVEAGNTYYWKVVATNGALSRDSDIWRFCINKAPDAPSLISPSSGTSLKRNKINLIWYELSSWGFNCDVSNNQYSLYVKNVGKGNPCPSFGSLVGGRDFVFTFDGGADSDSGSTVEKFLENLSWDTRYCWGVRASNGALTADSSVWYFDITHPDPWWQTQGGDVHGGGGISSPIPEACVESPTCKEYFSLALNGYSGLISSPSETSRDFGEGTATETQGNAWSIDGSAQALLNDYSYDKLDHLVDLAIKDNKEESFNSGVKVIKSGTINKTALVGASAGLYYYPPYGTGDMAVSLDEDNFSISANQKLVIFVEDNLNINKNISVTSGGFLAFIVSGNITIAPSVTKVQGVYFADGNLTVESNGATDSQFNGQGIFVPRGGAFLKRNFRSGANATTPAEIFTFDPSYLFTAPKVLREKPYLWQEVIP
jgi:hypothetical protein